MKNSENWVATKYELKNGRLRGSRNPKHLGVSSRLMTDITATFYQKYLPLHARGRLADLGCGFVPFYMLYKDLITQSICVDWPNSAHKNDFLDITCDLNKPLPMADSAADTIVISEVLEHIANPELLWQEMARILAPGGKILLSVPFFYKIHEAPYDYYRYTEFALRHLAEKNGLSVSVHGVVRRAAGDLYRPGGKEPGEGSCDRYTVGKMLPGILPCVCAYRLGQTGFCQHRQILPVGIFYDCG